MAFEDVRDYNVKHFLDATNDPSKTLHVVSCSKSKIWDKRHAPNEIEAKYAYTGPMVKQFNNYMDETKLTQINFVILSALYGFLLPEQKISRYNVSFANKEDKDKIIKDDVLEHQWNELNLGKYQFYFIWGGEPYYSRIDPLVKKCDTEHNKIVIAPAVGLPIGKAIQSLKITKNLLITSENSF